MSIDPSWAYDEALNNNPHLQNSPGLATDVLNSPNPLSTAPVLVQSATMNAVQQAAEDYVAENPVQNHWWDGAVHGAVGGLESLGKPLKEVQRDYKYIHSLYSRHGIIWGTLGTLAVAGGGTIGALVGGPMGAVLGAELAATGLRKIGGNLDEFKDSYADSENENYKVSAGRDFAHMLQIENTDAGIGKTVSGTVDLAFDIGMDPLMKLGVLSKVIKTGRYVERNGKFIPLLARSTSAQAFLERNSLRMYSADQVDALYQTTKSGNVADKLFGAGRQYERSLEELATMNSGDVIAKYPELQGLASEIGAAKGASEVHNIFLRTFSENDLMTKFAVSGSPFVPSRSLARAALSSVSDKLRQPGWDKLDDSAFEYRNAANFIVPRIIKNGESPTKFIMPVAFNPFSGEKWASALAKKTRTFSGYKPYVIDSGTLDLSTTKFNPNDPAALTGIYRVMRFSLGDKSARNITGAFADAPDLATKRSIYLSGLHEMFKAAGLPNDSHLVSDLLEQIGMHGEGTIGSGTYGHGLLLGDEASIVTSGYGSNASALWSHQSGTWAYPDFNQVKLAMRSMGHVGKIYGKVDDFWARNYTNSIFKPLALLTTGFGMRIAAGELIQSMIRFGGLDMAKAKIAGAAAKMNYKLIPGEDQHVLANAALALSGNDFDYTVGKLLTDVASDVTGKPIRSTVARTLTKIADPEDFDLAARITFATNGHMATGATLSGHGTEIEFTERQRQLMDLTGQRVKRAMTEAPDGKYSHYTAHDDHFDIHWISNLQKASQNKATQSIAADVREELNAGVKSVVDGTESWSNGPTLFHGTSNPIEGDQALSFYGPQQGNANLLYGGGFYTTDNPSVALSYTKKGKGKNPVVYNAKWTGENPPVFLNAESIAPPEVRTVWENFLINNSDLDYVDFEEVTKELTNPNATHSSLLNKLKEEFYNSDINMQDASEFFDEISNSLFNAGYDGIEHTGGLATNRKTLHNVKIFFDGGKLKLVRAERTESYQELQDRVWKLAQVKEEARIRGVQHDPSKPNSFGEQLSPAEDVYAGERSVLSRYKDQAPQTFAFHRVDDLRNTLTGTDGTFHDNFLNMIADRQKPMVTDVFNIDSASKPKAVIGPELEPYVGNNVMQRIIQTGFKKVIDPIVGNLSRQPLFFQHVKQAMKLYQPMIDAGKISEETGLRLAMTRASTAMLPQIHNTALRTQFSVLAQNYLPFYFAQEQAIKRYIKLGADNPQALRAYQLIEHGLNDPGFVQSDDQGNRYLLFPGVGELGAAAISGAAAIGLPVESGLPVTVRGNLISLKTVLPEAGMPGVSPIVAFSANSIASLHPEWSRQMKAIIGDMAFGRGIIDELIPSAPLRNLVKGVIIRDGDASFQNAMLSSIASASYAGQVPGPDASPAEKQAFLDRIKNNATSIMLIKAVLSAVSPLSPQVTQEDLGLRDEFYKLVEEKGDYPTALHEFLIKHGDGAISYTVSRSEGTIKGANMPYTDEVANWLEDNSALLSSNRAVGAAFLIPQSTSGGGDKQAIYDEIMKLHLRIKRTPQEFLDAIYSATGNNSYFQDKAIHDATIAAAGSNEKLVKAENANWTKYKSDFALANPIWADDFQSPEKRNIAKKAIDDLQYLFSNNMVPNTEQSRLVSGLLNDYKLHQETKDQIKGLNTKVTLTQENDNWDAYLTQLSQDEPRLTTIINGVFRRLD